MVTSLIGILAGVATLTVTAVVLGTGGVAVADEPNPAPERTKPTTCTYKTYAWSVEKKRGADKKTVEKAYSEVTDDERSPLDPRCTVCSEDQVTIDPSAHGIDANSFQVCWVYADDIEKAVAAIAADDSFEITVFDGYRAGRTRGKVVDGLRTGWSNHAFGTAIDINADANGLYRKCNIDGEPTLEKIEGCKLSNGGKWNPTKRPKTSIVKDGVVYREMTAFWKWGGEIDGKIRDLMHFSLDGY